MKDNVLTIAWAGTVNSDPAMVSISVRKSRYSYAALMETGVFVINLTTEGLAHATDFCGVKSGKDLDKFEAEHLKKEEAVEIDCPMLADSPVNIECRVTETKDLGSHTMFLAEVLAVSVDENYMDEKGKFSLDQTGLIAYSHGGYFSLGEQIGSFGYSVRKKK